MSDLEATSIHAATITIQLEVESVIDNNKCVLCRFLILLVKS